MKVLKKSAVLIIICLASLLQAQVFYSTDSDYLKIKTEKNNLTSAYRYAYPDTSLTEFSNPFPRNFLGNIGLSSAPYFLNYGTSDLGFRFFEPPTQLDRVKPDQVEYYRSKGPYATLTGISGAKQLQAFKLAFTHTYKDKINVTLKLNRYSSMGFYKRQQTYANNFFLSSNYTAANNRVGYYMYILNNGNRIQENGGISGGELDDSTVLISKELLPVRLSSANRDNRETRFMINPWLKLNHRPDSVKGIDHFVQLKSSVAFNLYRYRDAGIRNDNFYNINYLDTLYTNDSSNVRQFHNELSYSLVGPGSKIHFSAGYKNEINQLWQRNDSLFFNHLLVSDLVYRTATAANDTNHKIKTAFESALNFQYVLAGTNTGNVKIENRTNYYFNSVKNRFVFINLLYEKRNADYIFNYWNSNHFRWTDNKYTAQDQFQANAGISLGRRLTASVFLQSIYNYLYFDEIATPRQYPGQVLNTGFKIAYNTVLLKHLGVSVSYTLQNTSNDQYVRLPKNSGTAKLYYTASLFKNNLQLQLGSQVQLYQSFTAYAYMPSTQVFYLQENFKTQQYPFLDVYLNARIRPVSIFVKLENVLNSRVGTNYAFVPGYYQSDLAFRFGLTWMFFD
jgi:hypothetical protein